jgi:hypothetical protein
MLFSFVQNIRVARSVRSTAATLRWPQPTIKRSRASCRDHRADAAKQTPDQSDARYWLLPADMPLFAAKLD